MCTMYSYMTELLCDIYRLFPSCLPSEESESEALAEEMTDLCVQDNNT